MASKPSTRILLTLSFLIAILVGSALAETFSTTNIQILYGSHFDDRYFGYNSTDGRLVTLTFEHFGTWKYGDNFIFVDIFGGKLANFDGDRDGDRKAQIYMEWTPRLSLSAITGRKLACGIIRDVVISGQVDRGGDGFYAHLIGGGLDFSIPHIQVLSVNVWYRKDKFNSGTWQITPNWSVPFHAGKLHGSFDGFVDIYGTDQLGTEIVWQPQLVVDVGRLVAPSSAGHLFAGTEYYYHRNSAHTVSAPQLLLKWVW